MINYKHMTRIILNEDAPALNAYPGHLAAWQQFTAVKPPEHLLKSHFSARASFAELSRLDARFRLAKSFRGLELEGYSPRTERGYAALTRTSLVWSAFERFLAVINERQSSISGLLRGGESLVECVRKKTGAIKYFHFVRDQVNAKVAFQLSRFLSGESINPTYLAAGVRHIFVHGILTPSSGRSDGDLEEICDPICTWHLDTIDREFSTRTAAMCAEIRGAGG